MKKPQNLKALNLLSHQFAFRPHLSMEEIPNMGISSVNKAMMAKEAKGAQMTIFYGGEILVFDDIQAAKAIEIMSLAGKGISQSHNNYASFPSHNVAISAATPTCPFPQVPSTPIVCDLPLARKASLHRFLEKRKDRIAARAPYQTGSPMSWLAMVPKSPQENSETSSSVV